MQLNQAILCFWVDKIVSFIVLILYISHILFLADHTFFPGLKYWILFALVAARRWWKTRSQSWNLSAVFLAIRQRCVWSKQEPVGHSPPTHPHHVFWDSDRQKMKTTPNCHILSTLANAKKEKTRARATLLYMQRVCQWFFLQFYSGARGKNLLIEDAVLCLPWHLHQHGYLQTRTGKHEGGIINFWHIVRVMGI